MVHFGKRCYLGTVWRHKKFITSKIFPLISKRNLWPEEYGRTLMKTHSFYLKMSSVRMIFWQNSFDSLRYDSSVNIGSAPDLNLQSKIRLNSFWKELWLQMCYSLLWKMCCLLRDWFNYDIYAAHISARQNMKLITQTGKAENGKVRFVSD
jgi:hypothetical protein